MWWFWDWELFSQSGSRTTTPSKCTLRSWPGPWRLISRTKRWEAEAVVPLVAICCHQSLFCHTFRSAHPRHQRRAHRRAGWSCWTSRREVQISSSHKGTTIIWRLKKIESRTFKISTWNLQLLLHMPPAIGSSFVDGRQICCNMTLYLQS